MIPFAIIVAYAAFWLWQGSDFRQRRRTSRALERQRRHGYSAKRNPS